MTNAKRGRGSHRWVYLCTAVALGFALSGCGGGAAGAASTTSTESTAPTPPTASNHAVTLNWMPPTENTNGSPLLNLSGYDIHYGTSSYDLKYTITVSNPGLATYVVDDLAPGTYYFEVAAVNAQGTESLPSAVVRATVS